MIETLSFILGLVLLVYLARRFPLLWWAVVLAFAAWIFGW